MPKKITPMTASEAQEAANSLVGTEEKNAVNTGIVSISDRARDAGVTSGASSMVKSNRSGSKTGPATRTKMGKSGGSGNAASERTRPYTSSAATTAGRFSESEEDPTLESAAGTFQRNQRRSAAIAAAAISKAKNQIGNIDNQSTSSDAGDGAADNAAKASAYTYKTTRNATNKAADKAASKMLEKKSSAMREKGKHSFIDIQKKTNQYRFRRMQQATGTNSAAKRVAKKVGASIAKLATSFAASMGIGAAIALLPILLIAAIFVPILSLTTTEDSAGETVIEIPYKENGVLIGSEMTVTEYDSIAWDASSNQYITYLKWVKAGRKFKNGFAVLNGRYLIATTELFGSAGDDIDFYTNDGKVLHCTIADIKASSDTHNKWGHNQGARVIEPEVSSQYFQTHGHINPGKANGWPFPDLPNYYTPKGSKNSCYLVKAVNTSRSIGSSSYGGVDIAAILATNAPSMTKKQIEAVTKTTGVQKTAIKAALTKLGAEYVFGAAGPKTFDCSGLVTWAYKQAGVEIDHGTATYKGQIGRVWKRISLSDVQPGDVLAAINAPGASDHAAIALGSGYYINAVIEGVPLRIDNSYPWNYAFRIIK